MPVAVTLGGDPAMTFAATAPLPDGLDEVLFAGFVRKKSVDLVKCETIDLEVPGRRRFRPRGLRPAGRDCGPEGPFGDHTGFYTPLDDYPVFHLTAITHRRDADLSRHHRRHAADGGFLHGQRQRAASSCRSSK